MILKFIKSWKSSPNTNLIYFNGALVFIRDVKGSSNSIHDYKTAILSKEDNPLNMCKKSILQVYMFNNRKIIRSFGEEKC